MNPKEIDEDLIMAALSSDSSFMESIEMMGRVQKRARETAHEGVEAIETRLQRLVELAEMGGTDSLSPSDFLSESCLELWRTRKNLEPIFYLYDKYYSQRVKCPDGNDPKIGVAFTSAMAEIASQTEGNDRQILIQSTIGFLARWNPDMTDRIYEFAYFAKDLVNEGAVREGRELATVLKNNVPQKIAEAWDFNEVMKETFGEEGRSDSRTST